MDKKCITEFTFSSFLSEESSQDYIVSETSYEEQIAVAAADIKDAEYVLIGVGAGMSIAAGAEYGGKFFDDHFGEFQKIYGKGRYMQDMYSAGFYPFPDMESYWGLWSRLALLSGVDIDVTPLYKVLVDALADKKTFVLSTNVDSQFEKAGYPKNQIFNTQGSCSRIQCQRGCHEKTYDAVNMFRQMELARENGKVPAYMVPKCPVCGGWMKMNLRDDDHFVQDEAWYAAEKRFGIFLSEAVREKLALLELGVGLSTPVIIRFPFEKLAREYKNIHLVRLNLSFAFVPASLKGRAIGINADMARSITDIARLIQSK